MKTFYVLLFGEGGILPRDEPFGVAVTTEEEAERYVAEGGVGYSHSYGEISVFDTKDAAIKFAYPPAAEAEQGDEENSPEMQPRCWAEASRRCLPDFWGTTKGKERWLRQIRSTALECEQKATQPMSKDELRKEQIEKVVIEIMSRDSPDGHVDGYEVLTDYILALLDGKGDEWVEKY